MNQSRAQCSVSHGAEWRPYLGVLDASLGSTVASLGGEQTFQQLHLVERDFGTERPQTGSLTMLVVHLQPLAHKPAKRRPDKIRCKPLVRHTVVQYYSTRVWKSEAHLRWSWGQAWSNNIRDWRKAVSGRWPGPTVLKKLAAMGPRGLRVASGGGNGSMWRTDTAKLLRVNLRSSSGRDSSLCGLDAWAETRQWQFIGNSWFLKREPWSQIKF